MDIKSLKRDSAAVAAGLWVGEIPGMGDLRLKVRGLSSPVVVALRGRKERAVPRDERERDGSIKPDVGMQIMGELLHEAVLFDWDGLTDAGAPVPYDPEKAQAWLTDPDFAHFADAVVYAARVVDQGRAATDEDLEKNSGRPSAGRQKAAS